MQAQKNAGGRYLQLRLFVCGSTYLHRFRVVCVLIAPVFKLNSLQPPFDGISEVNVVMLVLDGIPPPRPAEMEDEMWTLVQDCLCPDFCNRPRASALVGRMGATKTSNYGRLTDFQGLLNALNAVPYFSAAKEGRAEDPKSARGVIIPHVYAHLRNCNHLKLFQLQRDRIHSINQRLWMWYIKTRAHDLLIFRNFSWSSSPRSQRHDFNDSNDPLDPSHEDGALKAIRAIDHQLSQLDNSARTLRGRRNALAPISTLPPEILSMVFMYAEAASNDSLAWIKVSHVCQHWRAVALDSPGCGRISCLVVRNGRGRCSNAPRWPPRHQSRPLLPDASPPRSCSVDDEADTSHAQSQYHRQPFHIKYHIRRLARRCSPASVIEPPQFPAPWSASNRHPSVPSAMKAPRLRHLELLQCNVEWNSPFLRSLTHFKLRDATSPSMEDLISALQAMPYLEVLEFQNTLPRPDLGLAKREVRMGS
ncbi:F-box domain-containing protein [Salix suchowensis]|nr:F-box domain-containing protein [Salix suchowensis]